MTSFIAKITNEMIAGPAGKSVANKLIETRPLFLFPVSFSEFAALDLTAKEIGLGENIAVKLNRRKRNAKTQYHARELQQLKSLCISHKI